MSSVPLPMDGTRVAGSGVRAWRMGVAVIVTLVAVFFLYWPSADSLIALWGNTGRTTYTHGFIIAAITLYLVWRKRDRLATTPTPSVAAALFCGVLAIGWLIAWLGVIEIVHQLLLLALLWTSIWALFGLRIAGQLWIPVGYLVFAIPAWDEIIPVLQWATTQAVAVMLKVSSIPAYVDGNTVHLAVGVFEVAGGCSGIHFFIVALALATLHGEISRDSMKVRIMLVALAASLALFANWLRVYIIVVAGHLTNMQHWLIQEGHYNFGWGVFCVMMVIYLLIARRFALPAKDESIPRSDGKFPTLRTRLVGMLAAAACIAFVPVWIVVRPVQSAPMPEAGTSLPAIPSGWSRVDAPTMAWSPVFAGADHEERGEYVDADGQHLAVFMATYAVQRMDKELVAYGNSLVGENAGAVISTNTVAADPSSREVVVEEANRNALIRYQYRIGDHRTARGIEAQLRYGIGAMTGATSSAVVAIRTPCLPDCESARKRLDQWSTRW